MADCSGSPTILLSARFWEASPIFDAAAFILVLKEAFCTIFAQHSIAPSDMELKSGLSAMQPRNKN